MQGTRPAPMTLDAARAYVEAKVEPDPHDEEYRATHSRDGYALGTRRYPNNRQGRRALARTWKRGNR